MVGDYKETLTSGYRRAAAQMNSEWFVTSRERPVQAQARPYPSTESRVWHWDKILSLAEELLAVLSYCGGRVSFL